MINVDDAHNVERYPSIGAIDFLSSSTHIISLSTTVKDYLHRLYILFLASFCLHHCRHHRHHRHPLHAIATVYS